MPVNDRVFLWEDFQGYQNVVSTKFNWTQLENKSSSRICGYKS